MLQAKSTLSSKGQLTIPLEIRKKLGLRQGDQIEISVIDDSIRLRKTNEFNIPPLAEDDPIFTFIGMGEGPEDLSEMHDKYIYGKNDE
ncbi:AbrB/MazE/SpoVT family DNA-binding domain-containing protein [Syntrophomonas wolfei]|jgi:AbrB family looped-hinge helix DNA binding protein|uniref:AbrB/MazE/SpoVT family DNA-binding domain-containing protein n=1 Tax=Syntrophomonas wolfei TaxID=863 RepID=UPI0007736CE9|nr:AbrB/MazE/SpoVT family DNA-binding domain-containing protein [Syntrophomonas wolfei]